MKFDNKLIETIDLVITDKLVETNYGCNMDSCKELFFNIENARNSDIEIEKLFYKAYKESPRIALKILMYVRDIRFGLGQRYVFRKIFGFICNKIPSVAKQIINFIPEIGRFDDLLVGLHSDCEFYIIEYIKRVLLKDINNLENGDEVSLLGKWLPSINTSSKEVVNMGKYLAKKLGLKYKEYRKLLTRLRNAPNIKNISLINNVSSNRDIDIEFLKEMSKVVPTSNTLVIKDDSYSMGCNNISVALQNHFTCYFAGLLKGKFNNKYLNFSSDGKMMKFKSDNFEDKLKELENYNVHGNLCLSKILKELLVEYKQGVENSEMIDRILIITDTEFELSIEDDKNYDGVVKEYSSLGFRKPEIIYWNINCNRITYTKHIKYSNVICVNGVDCSVIKALVNYNSLSDIEFIKESIKRYTFVDQILI